MKRSVLLAYQWITGLSDTLTGAMLYLAPWFTMRIMGVHVPSNAAPWVGYIGAFVLSVGLAGLYGAYLVVARGELERIETVWLLTAFSRAAVALFLLKSILAAEVELSWMSVVVFDGACVLVQGIGLRRRWLVHAQ